MLLLNTFFFYSFLGWLWEIGCTYYEKHKCESGILYGPYTPIYGVGALLIIKLAQNIFIFLTLPKIIEIPLTIFIIMIFVTTLEWITGILIENIFHCTLWNYHKFKYHIGKYIALEISLLWGFFSLILLYIINPIITPYLTKIPKIITYTITIFFIIDCIITFTTRKIRP